MEHKMKVTPVMVAAISKKGSSCGRKLSHGARLLSREVQR
jgi:hypothetical protein